MYQNTKTFIGGNFDLATYVDNKWKEWHAFFDSQRVAKPQMPLTAYLLRLTQLGIALVQL